MFISSLVAITYSSLGLDGCARDMLGYEFFFLNIINFMHKMYNGGLQSHSLPVYRCVCNLQ